MRRSLAGRLAAPSLAFLALSLLAGRAITQAAPAAAAPAAVKALVGGRLIDGFGGAPLADSVVVIEGERITAVGRLGEVGIPAGAEVISTEGMDVLPGLWDNHVHLEIVGHADYDHWDRTYPPLYRSTIMPAAAKQLLLAGVTSARLSRTSSRCATPSTAARSPDPRCTSPAPSSSTSRTPGPRRIAGA